jgi:hypothetical protein
MSPNVLCQQSFFTLAPDPWRPLQFFRSFGDLPVSPVSQHLLAEPPHLLDHAPLRVVRCAQVIPHILNQVDQALNPSAQLRMPVQSGQQARIFGGQRSAHRRSSCS